jgi:hypothetical protein
MRARLGTLKSMRRSGPRHGQVALSLALLLLVPAKGRAAAQPGSGPGQTGGDRKPPASASAASFSIRQEEPGWWLVSPKGQPFFSLGICCVNQGLSRKEFDSENPGYAAWQQYQDTRSWADETTSRLKSWGFTTIGAWSDHQALRESKKMTLWLTPILHIGSTAGAPWWDMWDARVIRRMEDVARGQILAVRDDPRLLGYYTDNELGWWNATLFKMTLEQAAGSGQRNRLLELLRETYANDWQKLLKDFEAENAAGWEELASGGMLYLRSDGNGMQLMRRFLGTLAERYYQLAHQIIRKYDTRALILGDRYQSFYYPEVARACARHVDAISSNLNASWNDGTFLRFYLDTLHALTGKPIMISEIYMAARENRTGNKNSHGVFPVVASQTERAAALRNTLQSLTRLPYVIGADWFQYYDEPRHGRDDGENFNFGLVDIQGRVYEQVAGVPKALDLNRLKARNAPPRPDASGGVPPAPDEPLGQFEPMRALRHWDRERGFVKPVSEFPLGDLYLCWSPQAVYVGLYAVDIIEDAYYRNRSVPKNDRPLWMVEANGGAAVRARLGGDREPIVSDPEVHVQSLSCHNLEVRNIAIMELPASRLGKDVLKAGDSLEVSSVLQSHGRAYQVEWKGKFTLSDRRP